MAAGEWSKCLAFIFVILASVWFRYGPIFLAQIHLSGDNQLLEINKTSELGLDGLFIFSTYYSVLLFLSVTYYSFYCIYYSFHCTNYCHQNVIIILSKVYPELVQ